MNDYNVAFFGLYENVFKLMKQDEGEKKALLFFKKLMEVGLSNSYGTNFRKGDTETFMKLVGERDKNVGLKVDFPKIGKKEIVYQFHDDPFPGLKGLVEHRKLDACYLSFKVKYILGNEWQYKTTKHIWDGCSCSEHIIFRD